MVDKASLLIYPGNPEFDLTLTTFPPNWREKADRIGGEVVFVAEPGSGLLRPANSQELTEYLYGGEYDERSQELAENCQGLLK